VSQLRPRAWCSSAGSSLAAACWPSSRLTSSAASTVAGRRGSCSKQARSGSNRHPVAPPAAPPQPHKNAMALCRAALLGGLLSCVLARTCARAPPAHALYCAGAPDAPGFYDAASARGLPRWGVPTLAFLPHSVREGDRGARRAARAMCTCPCCSCPGASWTRPPSAPARMRPAPIAAWRRRPALPRSRRCSRRAPDPALGPDPNPSAPGARLWTGQTRHPQGWSSPAHKRASTAPPTWPCTHSLPGHGQLCDAAQADT